MSMATSPVEIMLYQMLHCLTFGGYFYIGTTLTAKLIPIELRASGQAIYALSWGGLAGIIAGLVGGWMFQELGPTTMYQIAMFIALGGMVGFLLLWQRMKKQEEQEKLQQGA